MQKWAIGCLHYAQINLIKHVRHHRESTELRLDRSNQRVTSTQKNAVLNVQRRYLLDGLLSMRLTQDWMNQHAVKNFLKNTQPHADVNHLKPNPHVAAWNLHRAPMM